LKKKNPLFRVEIQWIHPVGINLYRLLRGYVWLAANPGPAAYFGDLSRWDNIAHDAINAVVTWIGDSLMIYRCYIVWNKRIVAILLPLALLIVSIVSNSIALHLFVQVGNGAIFSDTLVHWMSTIYAVAFVQNTLTSGLIAFRLWFHERRTVLAGMRSGSSDGSQTSLMPVMRIVVESAGLYVVVVLILIILYAIDSNAQYIVQEAFVPIVGIVFTLINLRIALHQDATASRRTTIESMRWKLPSQRSDTTGTTTGLPESDYTSSLSTMQFPEGLPLRSRHQDPSREEKEKDESMITLEPKVFEPKIVIQGADAC